MSRLPIRILTAKRAVPADSGEETGDDGKGPRQNLPMPAGSRPQPVPAGGKGRSGLPVAVNRGEVAQIINDFQSDTAEIIGRKDPLFARMTLFVLAAMVVAALTWMSLAEIDRIVMARGKIISSVPGLVVQPLDTAIIKSIDVQVGDVVKAGQALATLDPTFTEADVAQIQSRVTSLDAQIARLEAEYADRPFEAPSGAVTEQAELQTRIWRERQEQYASQMRQFDEKLAGIRASLVARQQELSHLNEQLKIATEIERMQARLLETNTASRRDWIRAQDAVLEVRRDITSAQSAVQSGNHELQSLEAQREVYIKQWRTKIGEDLGARRDERNGLVEQLAKARKRLELVRLEAQVDAVVLEIGQKSVGSVVSSAEPLFKLVPLNAPLEVEASIDSRDFGYVQIGDPVEIKLDAYSFMEHGVMLGKVHTISEDAFPNKEVSPQNPFGSPTVYKTRITLTETKLHNVSDTFRLVPGMPLTAEIKVGTRSVLKYFLRPILRGVSEGLREP